MLRTHEFMQPWDCEALPVSGEDFPCPLKDCKKPQNTLEELKRHMKSHRKNIAFTRQRAAVSKSQPNNKDVFTVFKCLACSTAFLTREKRAEHIAWECPAPVLLCPFAGCGETFCKSQMASHVTGKHHDEPNWTQMMDGYACFSKGCSYVASSAEYLHQHMTNVHKVSGV
ncbi:hypothetical protein QBC32DRAFT_159705 [Pseudoneurospora amorphoporcata]|uniref:C2H2-type domain-containing protein n=1 Tax=Pseudoneurospora amorphoporcata TaxID=241081 RepID=A0AAN6NWW5_9PEZI|nr:hypothetical protein QBC32DRAFT_159705 [Pseudoneurospora amorphoporcata]